MNKQKKILAVDDSLGWINYHLSALEEIYGAEIIVVTATSAREAYIQFTTT